MTDPVTSLDQARQDAINWAAEMGRLAAAQSARPVGTAPDSDLQEILRRLRTKHESAKQMRRLEFSAPL